MNDDHRAKPANHWLNSTVLGIGLASLFGAVGHEMATTAMPALLATLKPVPPRQGSLRAFRMGCRALRSCSPGCTAIASSAASRWR